jgi:hypothetical protein
LAGGGIIGADRGQGKNESYRPVNSLLEIFKESLGATTSDKHRDLHPSFRRSVHIEPRVGDKQIPVRTSVAASRNQHQQFAARSRNKVAVREETGAPSRAFVSHYGKWRIPHDGYRVVTDKIRELANRHKADHEVALSGASNPLPHDEKITHARKMFPGINFTSERHPTFLAHAADINKRGYDTLHVVVGSDRADEFKKTLETYNGKPDKKGNVLYHFPGGIHVHTAGEERVEGAEGTAGASSTQQEKHAKEGNFSAFSANAPKGAKPEHVKALYSAVRRGMQLESFTPLKFSEFIIG